MLIDHRTAVGFGGDRVSVVGSKLVSCEVERIHVHAKIYLGKPYLERHRVRATCIMAAVIRKHSQLTPTPF
jgi:hypothetical protein